METITRLSKEAQNDRKGFIKRTLARAETEDPYLANLVTSLAKLARIEFEEKGSPHADALHELVLEVSMYCFRGIELAERETSARTQYIRDALMRDPDAPASTSEGRGATAETQELIDRLMKRKK
jgi:hypothetical protein